MKFVKVINFKKKECEEITNIILEANKNTILAQIGKDFIINIFLKECIYSKNINVFIVKELNMIIGYAIIAKNQILLNREFERFRFKIIFNLMIKLKISQLINLFLIFYNFDLKMLKKKKITTINNSLNLTYLAIHKNYRNKGVGKEFLEYIFDFYKNIRTITVETDNKNTLNFYIKYLNFEIVGIRRRLPKRLFLLIKNF